MLLHITQIEQTPAAHLRAAVILPTHRAASVPPAPWRALPIIGLATLESTEEIENGTRTITTKLTATLATPIIIDPAPQSFRLTTAHGPRYLLGTAQAPFPQITQDTTLGGKPAENAATSLIITLKGTPLLHIQN